MADKILDFFYPDLHDLMRTAQSRVTGQDAYSPVSKPLETLVHLQDADVEAASVAAAQALRASHA